MKNLSFLFLANSLLCSIFTSLMLIGPQILYNTQTDFVFNIIRSLGFTYFTLTILSICTLFYAKSKASQSLASITFAVFHTSQALSYYIGFATSYSPLIFIVIHTLFGIFFVIASASTYTSLLMNVRRTNPQDVINYPAER